MSSNQLPVPQSPAPEVDEEPIVSAPSLPAGLRPGLSLPRQVAALAVWPFLEQMLTFLVGFIDLTIAGRLLSVEVTTAIGTCVYMLWLQGMLVGATGVGATALISRAAGAGRWRRANRLLGQGLLLAVVFGALATGVFFFGAPLLASLSLTGTSWELSSEYLRIVSIAVIFSAVFGVGAACLRGSGDTRTPFLTMVLVNLINIGACLALVHPASPIGGHGIRGLAYGWSLGWIVGALTLLIVLIHGRSRLRLQNRFLAPRPDVLLRIIRIGIPNLLESLGMWIGNYIVVAIVGQISAFAVGAHIIAIRIEAVSYLPGFALGIAAATLVGQFLGAGDPGNARKAAWWCWLYGTGLMTALGLLFIAIPEQLVAIVTNKQEFLSASPQLLRIVGCVQIGFASAIIFSSVHRGAGDTGRAMLITYGSTFLIRLPLVWLMAVHWKYGLTGVWIALSAELMVRGLLFTLSFLSGRWEKVRV